MDRGPVRHGPARLGAVDTRRPVDDLAISRGGTDGAGRVRRRGGERAQQLQTLLSRAAPTRGKGTDAAGEESSGLHGLSRPPAAGGLPLRRPVDLWRLLVCGAAAFGGDVVANAALPATSHRPGPHPDRLPTQSIRAPTRVGIRVADPRAVFEDHLRSPRARGAVSALA